MGVTSEPSGRFVAYYARLDRLAQNVALVSGLMERKVRSSRPTWPSADRFMLHVYPAVAEEKVRMIGERMRVALAAAKARGVRLGEQGRINAERHKAEAETFARQIAPPIDVFRAEEHTSVRALVEELNRRAIPTPKRGRSRIVYP